MNSMKRSFIKSITILTFTSLFILVCSVILNFYLSTFIEKKISKDKLNSIITKSFDLINNNYEIKAKLLLDLNRKMNYLNQERMKLIHFRNIINKRSHIAYFFEKNTPFYKINKDETTEFFYMSNFSFEFQSNTFSTSYAPNLLLKTDKKITDINMLNDDEIDLLEKETKKVLSKIRVDIETTLDFIKKILETDKSLDSKYINEEFRKSLDYEKNILLDNVNAFTPEVLINLLSISKIFILGILGFAVIVLIIIIRQLIDSYNKANIIESLSETEDILSSEQLNKQKEMILLVNEFYKTKKEESKDIIVEAIKATNRK